MNVTKDFMGCGVYSNQLRGYHPSNFEIFMVASELLKVCWMCASSEDAGTTSVDALADHHIKAVCCSSARGRDPVTCFQDVERENMSAHYQDRLMLFRQFKTVTLHIVELVSLSHSATISRFLQTACGGPT